ncbi:MAG: peptidoglycan-binding domain-containing protein [Christensenellales bacterium]|jgi:peptidoglycan hydrolase-like protein with peptidoglycan-binding domain
MYRKIIAALLTVFFLSAAFAFSEPAYDVYALYPGDRGEDVRSVQTALIELGYLDGRATGTYNEKTQLAVADFQYSMGISQEELGIAGETTMYLLSVLPVGTTYCVNLKTYTYHLAGCSYALNMTKANREYVSSYAYELEKLGYTPCSLCNPAGMYWDEYHINWYDDVEHDFVANTASHKFHIPQCRLALNMSAANRFDAHCTRTELIEAGYSPCKICNP